MIFLLNPPKKQRVQKKEFKKGSSKQREFKNLKKKGLKKRVLP